MASRSLAWAAGVLRHAADALAKRKVGAPNLGEILHGGSYADASSRVIEYLTEGRPRIATEEEAIAAAAAIGAYLRKVPQERRSELAKTIAQAIPELQKRAKPVKAARTRSK